MDFITLQGWMQRWMQIRLAFLQEKNTTED